MTPGGPVALEPVSPAPDPPGGNRSWVPAPSGTEGVYVPRVASGAYARRNPNAFIEGGTTPRPKVGTHGHRSPAVRTGRAAGEAPG